MHGKSGNRIQVCGSRGGGLTTRSTRRLWYRMASATESFKSEPWRSLSYWTQNHNTHFKTGRPNKILPHLPKCVLDRSSCALCLRTCFLFVTLFYVSLKTSRQVKRTVLWFLWFVCTRIIQLFNSVGPPVPSAVSPLHRIDPNYFLYVLPSSHLFSFVSVSHFVPISSSVNTGIVCWLLHVPATC